MQLYDTIIKTLRHWQFAQIIGMDNPIVKALITVLSHIPASKEAHSDEPAARAREIVKGASLKAAANSGSALGAAEATELSDHDPEHCLKINLADSNLVPPRPL